MLSLFKVSEPSFIFRLDGGINLKWGSIHQFWGKYELVHIRDTRNKGCNGILTCREDVHLQMEYEADRELKFEWIFIN